MEKSFINLLSIEFINPEISILLRASEIKVSCPYM